MAGGGRVQAGGEPLAQGCDPLDHAVLLDAPQTGQRGGHRIGVHPEGAGAEHAAGCALHDAAAKARRDRIAVGDRLRIAAQVRLVAEPHVRASQVRAEADADVVADQQRAAIVGERAQAVQEPGVRKFGVCEGRVVVWCDHHRRHVPGVAVEQVRDAVQVVPAEAMDMGQILFEQAGMAGHRPRMGAVVGAVGGQHLAAPGMGARGLQRVRGHVRAVDPEQRPVHAGDAGGQLLGQLHHLRAGRVEAEAPPHRGGGGGVDGAVAVAEQVAAEAAQEVDVLVAVDVPEAAACAALGVIGKGARHHQRRALGAVDAARDHLDGAGQQLSAAREAERHGHHPASIILPAASARRRPPGRRHRQAGSGHAARCCQGRSRRPAPGGLPAGRVRTARTRS